MKLGKIGHLDGEGQHKLCAHPTFMRRGRSRFYFKGKLYRFWTAQLSAGHGIRYEEVELTYGYEFEETDILIVEELNMMLEYFMNRKD